MSFHLDMGPVYQQFANVFGSLSPLLYPFIGGTIALFVFGGVMFILRTYQQGR